jgi:uncharacterized protein (DUF362 family)
MSNLGENTVERRLWFVLTAVLATSQWAGCGDSEDKGPADAGGSSQLDTAGASGGDTTGMPGIDAEDPKDVTIAIDSSGGGSSKDVPVGPTYVVSMLQSDKAQASDITQEEVAALVASAVAQAGGLDFIKDGQTVVLKPNLVTPYTDSAKRTAADPLVNGIATDWRVVKATADLVRAKNPNGKILVMEGSVVPTMQAFAMLGYTAANFGTAVDEFIAIEGSSCGDRSTAALEQRTSINGAVFWVNKRYVRADVVISLPTMKTHSTAGITGAVKNLGIGTTPVGQYSAPPVDAGGSFGGGPGGGIDGGRIDGAGIDGGAIDGGEIDGGAIDAGGAVDVGGPIATVPQDCTRGQTPAYIDHTSAETLGQFIHDNYSIRPADFVVMDALQGLQHGPLPAWDNSGRYTYASSKMNMRLILAGKNAVAVDTIEALVMKCDPLKVPHLTKLAASGLGTTDVSRITVVGKQPSEVAVPFAGKQTAICPGI